MTGDESGESGGRKTLLIDSYPMLDFYLVGLLSILYTVTVVGLVGLGWQRVTGEDAGTTVVVVGGTLVLGSFLAVRLLSSDGG